MESQSNKAQKSDRSGAKLLPPNFVTTPTALRTLSSIAASACLTVARLTVLLIAEHCNRPAAKTPSWIPSTPKQKNVLPTRLLPPRQRRLMSTTVNNRRVFTDFPENHHIQNQTTQPIQPAKTQKRKNPASSAGFLVPLFSQSQICNHFQIAIRIFSLQVIELASSSAD